MNTAEHLSSKQTGFTLLELSITLVIIGLIIGGITVGQNMIRSAELQNFMGEYASYQKAFFSFKLKYNAIPGDMDNAQDYWPTDCLDHATLGTWTCNGNGTGRMGDYGTEPYRAWQHLALAETMKGSYDGGQAATSDNDSMFPRALSVDHIFWWYGPFVHNDPATRHFLYINVGTITTAEAFQLDEKHDDGVPTIGNIVVSGSSNGGCTGVNFNAGAPAQSTYVAADGTVWGACGHYRLSVE